MAMLYYSGRKKMAHSNYAWTMGGFNAICVENMYFLPLMKDMLGHLAKENIFTKLDLREAYYRV